MEEQPSTKIVVNKLPKSFKDCHLDEILCNFPGYLRCNLVYNVVTRESCCYGFADFLTHEDAVNCVGKFEEREKLTGYQLRAEDKDVRFSLARPHGAAYQKTKIRIDGVPATWSHQDLGEYFEHYCGPIIHAYVVPRQADSPHPTTYGFVIFEKRDQAFYAIDLHAPPVSRGDVVLHVKMAKSK